MQYLGRCNLSAFKRQFTRKYDMRSMCGGVVSALMPTCNGHISNESEAADDELIRGLGVKIQTTSYAIN